MSKRSAPATATTPPPTTPAPTTAQRLWRRFCRLAVFVLYRRREVHGLETLPTAGPVVVCANHVNSLADALIVQAALPRPIHPLARSGLFRNPFLRPLLRALQAVPVYRRHEGRDTDQVRQGNEESFDRCFEYLGECRTLLIFPEGHSHSEPMLRPLKTGAARLALGARDRYGSPPTVVPVGLVFTHKGRFRTSLLVQVGDAVEPGPRRPDETPEEEVRRFTAQIERGLEAVTINVESWEDLALLRRLQSFFDLRRAARRERRERRRGLAPRVRALKRLEDTHRWLRARYPEEVARLRLHLERFERLCRRYGVATYQLELRYRPLVVGRFLLRAAAFSLLVLPLVAWGVLNSLLPYLATRLAARAAARGRDQVDSARIFFGLGFFLLAWSGQTAFVADRWGLGPAVAYAVSLPVTATVALLVGRERKRLYENARVFLLFLRKRRLRDYLRQEREAVETEVATLARLARHRVADETGGVTAPSVPSVPSVPEAEDRAEHREGQGVVAGVDRPEAEGA